jgi:hypothetical protein
MAFKSISGKQALPNGTKIKYDLAPNVDKTIVGTTSDIMRDFSLITKAADLSVLKGTGKIVGISSELPIFGFMYIIETDSKISEVYPYTCFVCAEIYLEQI